jgi:hypothetical protein
MIVVAMRSMRFINMDDTERAKRRCPRSRTRPDPGIKEKLMRDKIKSPI